jgi:hypothetical protein
MAAENSHRLPSRSSVWKNRMFVLCRIPVVVSPFDTSASCAAARSAVTDTGYGQTSAFGRSVQPVGSCHSETISPPIPTCRPWPEEYAGIEYAGLPVEQVLLHSPNAFQSHPRAMTRHVDRRAFPSRLGTARRPTRNWDIRRDLSEHLVGEIDQVRAVAALTWSSPPTDDESLMPLRRISAQKSYPRLTCNFFGRRSVLDSHELSEFVRTL